MIAELLVMGCFALFIGFGLVYASKRLGDEPDPAFDKVLDTLPGANCGGCGFGGCRDYAKAIMKNPALIGRCGPGGKEVSDALSLLLHHAGEMKIRFAWIRCKGGEYCIDKAEYLGIKTCKAASMLHQGQKACSYGCMGFGDCVSACAYGALRMGDKGFPIVDPSRCVACGKCVAACPKKIPGIYEKKTKVPMVSVECRSKDPGKMVASICKNGCIACGLCVKACPKGAITITDNLSVIDYQKCDGCGKCVAACPKKVISEITIVDE